MYNLNPKKMKEELLLACTVPQNALKEMNDFIESVSAYPKGGIKLKHTLVKDLHMSDDDILDMMKKIERHLGNDNKAVFGADDNWKKMKTVNDVINKVTAFARKELLSMITTTDGAVTCLKALAVRESLISEGQEVSLEDNVETLNLDSLDCLQIMAKFEEAFDLADGETMFREEWRDIKTVGDFVADVKEYALKHVNAN